jgi:chemotaxis protein MotB
MSKIKLLAVIIAGLVLITGCVSSKKYDESLHNAMTLQNAKADLEEKLLATEKELTAEKAAREALKAEVAGLQTDNQDLQAQNASLFGLNEELNRKLAQFMQERLQAIKEKDRSITELTQEKMQALKEKERAIEELRKTYDNLVSELNEEIKKGEIEVSQLKDKLTLSMVEKILFDSGSAEIKKNGRAVLQRVAEILMKVHDKQIRIEGHTDNVPIGPFLAATFPTNWELSTARSTTVVRFLQDQGIDPAYLSAAGYSEYRPVDSNETDEGKAKNRRIEIVLIPLEL